MRSNDNCNEIIIPQEDVLTFLESLRQKKIEEEEQNEQCQESFRNMQAAINNGKYNDAFVFAKELQKRAYTAFQDEIEACYLCCAEHDVREALVFLTERMIYRNDGKPTAEAFPYICRLADMGYIRSFLWAAECYDWGIGCSINRREAAKYYAEAILFENNARAKERYKKLDLAHDYPVADKAVWAALYHILRGEMGWMARVKFAELIMEGNIKEYDPAAAFAVLLSGYGRINGDEEGIYYLRLAECYLYGIGVETDYSMAYVLLEFADFLLECLVEDSDWGWQEGSGESIYEAKDYVAALEKVKLLLKETEEKVDCPDDMMLFDEIETVKPQWIKRAHKSRMPQLRYIPSVIL